MIANTEKQIILDLINDFKHQMYRDRRALRLKDLGYNLTCAWILDGYHLKYNSNDLDRMIEIYFKHEDLIFRILYLEFERIFNNKAV